MTAPDRAADKALNGEVLPPTSKWLTTAETDALAKQARTAHEAVERTCRDAVRYAKSVGLVLIKAKAGLPHGLFQHWLAKKTGIKPRTAQVYMRLARELPKLPEAKAKRVAHLSLRDALAELSRTSSKATKLEPSTLEWALAKACNNPLKGAMVKAANRKRQPTTAPTIVDRTAWGAPPGLPEPAPPSALAQSILRHLQTYQREHPTATNGDLLEALNEAYCLVQEGVADREPEARP